MKTMVSVLGTLLMCGAVALAQTSAGSGSASSKTSAKNSSGSYGTTNNSNSTAKAGNSGFDSGLPQSDASSSPSAQSGTATSGMQSGSSDEISNGPVAETISDSSATIGWATRTTASSTGIKYGANRASLSQTAQASDGSDGKNHHARLQGLSPSTRYYFQITENGQPVGGVGTFKTTASGETPVQSKAIIPQK
jgi:phosphodiesterase/alkaline phosphatase D-like protein